MAEHPEIPQDGWADSLSPNNFVSEAQALLRDEFARLTQQNEELLQNFDPEAPDAEDAELKLRTPFTEIEIAEPELAILQHNAMLSKLGLNFQPLSHDHPDFLLQHVYDDDSMVQIRYITRKDGVQVPIKSFLDENSNVTELFLLSSDGVQENIAHLQAYVDESSKETAILDLAAKLEVGEDALDDFYDRAASLTLEELQAALQDLENPTPEKVEGDDEFSKQVSNVDEAYRQKLNEREEAIIKARRNYVKAAMPAHRLLDRFMHPRTHGRAQRYHNLVEENLSQLGYVGHHVEMDRDREQSRRHAELNEQLRKRKLFTQIGIITMTGVADSVGIAATTAAGYFEKFGLNTEKGLAIGAVAAAAFTIQQFFRGRSILKDVAPFDPESTTPADKPLQEQLVSEVRHARRASRLLRKAQEI